jgi:hypothetical protein
LSSPFAASPADEQVILEHDGHSLRATPFRNTALVSAVSPAGVLSIAAFDPFEGSVTARHSMPSPVGSTSTADWMNLGASDGRGLVALCVPTGGPESSPVPDAPIVIKLYLFGPDLQPLGLPIDVGQMDDASFSGCEVGFSDDNILVAWWDQRVPVVHVRAVRP